MPMPISTSQSDLYNHYFESAAYPVLHMSPIYFDDLQMRPLNTPTPSNHFQSNPSMLGLPGGNADDLLRQFHPSTSAPIDEGQLDSMLLAYRGSHSDIDPASLQPSDFQDSQLGMQEALAHHDLDDLLDLPHDEYPAWQSDPTMVSLEQESEFDKWIGDH